MINPLYLNILHVVEVVAIKTGLDTSPIPVGSIVVATPGLLVDKK